MRILIIISNVLFFVVTIIANISKYTAMKPEDRPSDIFWHFWLGIGLLLSVFTIAQLIQDEAKING